MKAKLILFAMVVAIANARPAAKAEAVPEPIAYAAPAALAEADPRYIRSWGRWHFFPFCHLAGQGCRKVKRAADVMNEAFAEPTALDERDPAAFEPFCHLVGQGCKKKKRSDDGDTHDAYHSRIKRAAEEVNEILDGEDNEWANSLRDEVNKVLSDL